MTNRPPWKSFTVIAETGDRFRDFAPYVASLNDSGQVAFQAALRTGGSGIFAGDSGPVAVIEDSGAGRFADFFSHPDINAAGSVSFYAARESGERGIFRMSGGRINSVADTTGEFCEIGPLGPTMNDEGVVA